MSIESMRADLDYVLAELTELDRNAEVETRSLTEDEQVRYDAGLEFVESTTAAIETGLERAAKIEHARSVLEAVPTAVRSGSFEVPNVNLNRAIFADDPRDLKRASSDDLRSRALSAIESHTAYEGVSDKHRENATRLIESYHGRTGTDIAEHIIATGSPEYAEAFRDYMEAPLGGMSPLLARTAMSLTAANGGALVPQWLDPTIVLTNDGTSNEIRKIAGQVSITVDQWDGVTSAGVTAEWLSEGSQAADATPTFVAPTITPQKAAAYLFGSYEVLSDSGFAEVGPLLADAKARIEATGFTVGTGSGQPYGVVTRLSGTGPLVAGSSGAAGAADFVAADVFALDNALGPRWRNNASFLGSKQIYNKVRQLNVGNTAFNQSSFWVDFGGGTPSKLIGYEVYEASDMDSTIVSGSTDPVLILGDFGNGYKIVDRIGLSIMYNPLVVGSNQRPTGQAGWFGFWRVGGDVLTSSAFKTLVL